MEVWFAWHCTRVYGKVPPSSTDNYVHRLVQNKGDGKLVEVMAGQGLPSEEKIDSLQLEVRPLPPS